MAKYIFKRILTAIPLIIVITILCFSLIHLAPYDAIDAMTTPKMSPEMVQMIREKYGYDQPVYVQYIRWLEGILNGNFGYSIVTKTNIFDELATRIPNTIKLVLPSYLTAYVISIVLGLVAGSHKNKWLDKLIDGICSLRIMLWYRRHLVLPKQRSCSNMSVRTYCFRLSQNWVWHCQRW